MVWLANSLRNKIVRILGIIFISLLLINAFSCRSAYSHLKQAYKKDPSLRDTATVVKKELVPVAPAEFGFDCDKITKKPIEFTVPTKTYDPITKDSIIKQVIVRFQAVDSALIQASVECPPREYTVKEVKVPIPVEKPLGLIGKIQSTLSGAIAIVVILLVIRFAFKFLPFGKS